MAYPKYHLGDQPELQSTHKKGAVESHGTFSFPETIDTHQALDTFARASVTNSRQKYFVFHGRSLCQDAAGQLLLSLGASICSVVSWLP